MKNIKDAFLYHVDLFLFKENFIYCIYFFAKANAVYCRFMFVSNYVRSELKKATNSLYIDMG
jgi:hypothetical protein